MEIDKLTLVAGTEIPVLALKANIHQPTIREIAIIGEEKFYRCLGLFNINPENVIKALLQGALPDDIEKINLVKKSIGSSSDFELLMQILKDDPDASEDLKIICMMVLPNYNFSVEERVIFGLNKNGTISITQENFPDLKEVIQTMFCLNTLKNEEFNPGDDRAKAIADKLKRAREKVRNLNGESKEKTYILANYISSLGIGTNALNILNAVDLTVYQLFNQMERYGLYVQAEYAMRAAMAGAKDVEHIDWLKGL